MQYTAGIVKQFAEETPPDEWFGQQAVYRLSMGNFVSTFKYR